MDIAQVNPIVIGVVLACVVILFFGGVFYWATKDSELLYEGGSSLPNQGGLPKNARSTRTSRFKRHIGKSKGKFAKSFKNSGGRRFQPVNEIKGDMINSTDDENAKTPQEPDHLLVHDAKDVAKAKLDVSNRKSELAKRVAVDLLATLKELDGANADVRSVDKVSRWVLELIDPSVTPKLLVKKCLAVRSLCADARRVKSDAEKLANDSKRQLEKERSKCVQVAAQFKADFERVSSQYAFYKSDAESVKLTMKDQLACVQGQVEKLEGKIRVMNKDHEQLVANCLKLEREAERQNLDKIGAQKNLHVLKKKYSTVSLRCKELEDIERSLASRLQAANSVKTFILNQLEDKKYDFVTPKSDPDLVDWMIVKSEFETMCSALREYKDATRVHDDENLFSTEHATVNGNSDSRSEDTLSCATASVETMDSGEIGLATNNGEQTPSLSLVPNGHSMVDAHRRLIERTQDLHKKYGRLVGYSNRSESADEVENCLISLNDIDTGLDLMSNMIKMLSKESVDLKKRNEDLRSKNYKILDMIRLAEQNYARSTQETLILHERQLRDAKSSIVRMAKKIFKIDNETEDIAKVFAIVGKRLSDLEAAHKTISLQSNDDVQHYQTVLRKSVQVMRRLEGALKTPPLNEW